MYVPSDPDKKILDTKREAQKVYYACNGLSLLPQNTSVIIPEVGYPYTFQTYPTVNNNLPIPYAGE